MIFFVMLFASTFAFMFKMMGSTLNDFNRQIKRRGNIHPEMSDVKTGDELLIFTPEDEEEDDDEGDVVIIRR